MDMSEFKKYKNLGDLSKGVKVIDEAEDFNSMALCTNCEHLIYFQHKAVTYKADDLDERDMVVMKCTICDCHDVFI